MDKTTTGLDALVTADDKPKVSALTEEFKRAGAQGDHCGRLRLSEDVRLAQWEGQSVDGKKHDELQPDGKPAFPWNGASDVKDYLADEVVNEGVALYYGAFWQSMLRVSGTQLGALDDANTATTFLDWLVHTKMVSQLDDEVELSAQWTEGLGWVVLHIIWERKIERRDVKVSLEQLLGLAQQYQGMDPRMVPPEMAQLAEVIAFLPQFILRRDLEHQAVKAMQYVYEQYMNQQLPEDLQDQIRLLSDKRARKAVRELRATGETLLPMPYLCKNQPKITALKPWRDIIFPPETADLQDAPVVFVRQLMTEVDVRQMVISDGWDPDWVEEAVKTKGKFSIWDNQNPLTTSAFNWEQQRTKSWLIEVVTAYYRSIDEEGVVGVYFTIFSPHITGVKPGEELAAKTGLLNYPHGKYPFSLIRRERLDRAIVASRGIPEILATPQQVEKTMIDSVVDLTSVATVPPLLMPAGLMGKKFKFGPATQNEVQGNKKPEMMTISTAGATVNLEMIALLQQRVNRYAGRFSNDTPAALTQLLQMPKVRKFLSGWSEALNQSYQLTRYYAPELIERVTGETISDGGNVPAIAEEANMILHFDPAQLSPDLMKQKIAAFNELVPTDVAGVMDRAKLTVLQMRMIDPAMARELTIEQGQASQKIFNDVSMDLVKIFNGNEATYADASNDPAAGNKMQYATDILQRNPLYLEKLTDEAIGELFGPQAAQQMQQRGQAVLGQNPPSPLISQLLLNYMKNLKQGTEQQENKKVGRVGVKQLTGPQM